VRRTLLLSEAIALVAALVLRFAFAPAWRAQMPPLSVGDAVGTRLASLAKSAYAIALPVDRSICDAFPVTSLASLFALAGLLVAAALAFIAWRRRGPGLLLALAMLQSLDLVAAPRFWSPHYLYLPLAFAAMLVAEGLDRLGPRALALGGVAATLLGVVTLHDGRRYQSDETLFSYEVAARPECREAHFYLGESHRAAGDLEGAAQEYSRAIAVAPGMLSYSDEPAALQNLGIVRLQQGRIADAEQAFRAALERVPDETTRRRLVHDLALAALALSDSAEVVRLLSPEAARADAMPESLLLLAGALHDVGREEEARAVLARAKAGVRQ
jgi:tetratricopeptide (TPR) repeat protein